MRLLQRDLSAVHVFHAETVESGYVGTATKWVYDHTEKCNVQPAENRVTAEIYGEKIYNMYSVICPVGTQISEGNVLSFSGTDKPEYKVVSVKSYHTNATVLAELSQTEPFQEPEQPEEGTAYPAFGGGYPI